MTFRTSKMLMALAVGLVLAMLVPSYAHGAPGDDLQARAAQLEKGLEATNAQVAKFAEQLRDAQKRIEDAEAKIADAEARIKVAQDETDRLKSLVNERAARIYKGVGRGGPLDAFNVQDAKDVTARSKYGDVAASRDDALIDELAAAKQQLTAEKDAAANARSEAADQSDAAAKAKGDADAAASEQQRLLDQVNGKIEEALRALTAARAEQALRAQAAAEAEQARQAQAAAEAEQAQRAQAAAPQPQQAPPPQPPAKAPPPQPPAKATAPKPSGGVGSGGGSPLGSGGGAAAAAYAQAQVGKPYCNTNPQRFGPACYDCSGLTHMAWKAGGLTIPTISGPQGSAYPHVAVSQLQPGDLVSISSWAAHVGIWVGGGYVHATSYRNNPNAIKFVVGSGGIVDAVRPR